MLAIILVAAFGFAGAVPPAALTPASPLTDVARAVADPSPGAAFSAAGPRVPGTYFGARYYRANIGRFTTTDPVYTWRGNLVDPRR